MEMEKTEECTINELENLQTVFYWAQKSIYNKTNKNTHDDDKGDIDNKSSSNTIEFNGTRYKDVTVRPSNTYIGQSRYIIDEKGNGLLFTLRGSRVGGCCFPIKKNKILTTYLYYTTESEISGYDRPIATLIDSTNPNLLRSVITCFKDLLKKPRPSLPVTNPHPTVNNEYELPYGWKVNKKQEYTKHGAPLQTSLTFTDCNGNGKCIYTDGYIIPVENGKLMEHLGYLHPNGTNIFKELDQLVEDARSCHLQQRQQAYKDFANKYNKINLYKGKPKPQQRRFGRHDVAWINGCTFSVSRDISTEEIVSIMITNELGNGKCFYQDGYVNPVSNRQTFAALGTKQSLDVFKSLTKAIEGHNSDALSDFLRTQKLVPNNNISPISSGQYYNQNIQQQNPRQFFSSINGQNNMQQNLLLQQYQNWSLQLQNRNFQQQQYNNYSPLVNNFMNNNLHNVSNSYNNLHNISNGYNNLHNISNSYNNLHNVNNGNGLYK